MQLGYFQVMAEPVSTCVQEICAFLRGDGSRGEFYSIAISNGYEQVDSRHQDDPSRQGHVEPHHLQGHRRGPLQQHLSRARLGASARR